MSDFDPEDVPTGVHELPMTLRAWATRTELRHRQLRKEHDAMAQDVKTLRLAMLGDGTDPKKPGLVAQVDRIDQRIANSVRTLLIALTVASIMVPALVWLVHVASK